MKVWRSAWFTITIILILQWNSQTVPAQVSTKLFTALPLFYEFVGTYLIGKELDRVIWDPITGKPDVKDLERKIKAVEDAVSRINPGLAVPFINLRIQITPDTSQQLFQRTLDQTMQEFDRKIRELEVREGITDQALMNLVERVKKLEERDLEITDLRSRLKELETVLKGSANQEVITLRGRVEKLETVLKGSADQEVVTLRGRVEKLEEYLRKRQPSQESIRDVLEDKSRQYFAAWRDGKTERLLQLFAFPMERFYDEPQADRSFVLDDLRTYFGRWSQRSATIRNMYYMGSFPPGSNYGMRLICQYFFVTEDGETSQGVTTVDLTWTKTNDGWKISRILEYVHRY